MGAEPERADQADEARHGGPGGGGLTDALVARESLPRRGSAEACR